MSKQFQRISYIELRGNIEHENNPADINKEEKTLFFFFS